MSDRWHYCELLASPEELDLKLISRQVKRLYPRSEIFIPEVSSLQGVHYPYGNYIFVKVGEGVVLDKVSLILGVKGPVLTGDSPVTLSEEDFEKMCKKLEVSSISWDSGTDVFVKEGDYSGISGRVVSQDGYLVTVDLALYRGDPRRVDIPSVHLTGEIPEECVPLMERAFGRENG